MFSTIANDSVQTLGTFMTSNTKTKWWKMWIYISLIFICTIIFAWYTHYGEIDFQRLANIPYQSETTIFHILAPILLVILTYNKISVSTTFLILSVFTSQAMLGVILFKTIFGYFVGLGVNYLIWIILMRYFNKPMSDCDLDSKLWIVLEWMSTGVVWLLWLVNNVENIAVYVPRVLSIYELFLFLALGIIVIAFIFYNKGGPIQEIVKEKTEMTNIKYSCIFNLTFATIIYFIGGIGKIPMATTWIFIGALAGRELAMAGLKSDCSLTFIERYKKARKFILSDIRLAGIGILISLIFVIISNISK